MGVSNLSVQGQVAIVTGGSGEIGRAIALDFAEAGADVVACDLVVESDELVAVAKEIQRLGRRFLAVQADIGRKTSVDNMVQRVISEFGGIDILVNNAARPLVRKQLFEISEDDWDQEVDTNLKGYHLCCQAVAKTMIERKKGNIINIASISAIRVLTVRGAYSISKAGVVMLTKMLAVELGPYNIRVNAIAPGMVKTQRSRPSWGNPKALKQIEASIPLGRLAEPSDIASAALFLASEASRYITGHTIVVDGGTLA